MAVNIDHTKDPRSVTHAFGRGIIERVYPEPDWTACEVPGKLLRGYKQATAGGLYPDRRATRSVKPSAEVIKWLDKNCTGEWRWFYRVLGGYDRVTFLSFEKEEDLFYFRLRF